MRKDQAICVVCWEQDEVYDLHFHPSQVEKVATMRYGGRYADGGDNLLDQRKLVEWPPRGRGSTGLGVSQTGEVSCLEKIGCKVELTTVHSFPSKIQLFLKGHS